MSDEKPKRVVGKPFTRGDPRINLDGRPAQQRAEVEEFRKLSPEARAKLREQLASADEAIAQGAAKEILNRAWGKAPQAVSFEDNEGNAAGVGFVVVLPAEREE